MITHKVVRDDGQGRVNYELAKYLIQCGHQVIIVATDIDVEIAHHPNIVFYRVVLPRLLPTALLRNQMFALKSRWIVASRIHDYEILHVNGSISYIPSDVNSCHFVHSAWLSSPHHPRYYRNGLYAWYQLFYTSLNSYWERCAYANTKMVVAVSEMISQSLITDCSLPTQKITVIENGVDIQEFLPRDVDDVNFLKSEARLPDTAFCCFFVGDLTSNRKNLDLVLRSLVMLPENIHLVVAGSITKSKYPKLVLDMGLSERVHFLGHRSDIAALMRDADIFVFPSHYETFGLVVLEAMASGVPVITSANVGSHSLIQSGENGFIVDGSCVYELTTTVCELFEDQNLRYRLARAARLTAEQKTWLIMARSYEALYQKVVQLESPFRPDSDMLKV